MKFLSVKGRDGAKRGRLLSLNKFGLLDFEYWENEFSVVFFRHCRCNGSK